MPASYTANSYGCGFPHFDALGILVSMLHTPPRTGPGASVRRLPPFQACAPPARSTRDWPPTHRDAAAPALAGIYAIATCLIVAIASRYAPDALVRANALWLFFWVTTAAVAAAGAGQWYLHRRFSAFDFVGHNEVGGFMIAVVGGVYGVLLGFMTVVAWQHFSDSRQLVGQEAAAATDAWHTAVGLPASERSRVRKDMLQYANEMVDREWPAMQARGRDTAADWIVMDAIGSAGSFTPANFKEANAQSVTLQQLGTLHDYRQRRLSENGSAISWFEWLVLLVGGACIVGFCWLFGLENKVLHLVMTSAVTIIVASMLVLLFELQYPFQSDLRISSDDWSGAISHIDMMLAGPQSGMRM